MTNQKLKDLVVSLAINSVKNLCQVRRITKLYGSIVSSMSVTNSSVKQNVLITSSMQIVSYSKLSFR
jgi:hypothetical protein